MQEQKYQELEDRASQAAELDAFKKLEARARVAQEIEAMKAEGKALVLSDEEIELLRSFRRFKLRMTKAAETFSWQTRRPDGIEVVSETAQIIHPQEA